MEKIQQTKSFKAGTIQVNLWERENEKGEKMVSYTFQKSYKNENGDWQQTNSLFSSDIPKLILALEQAYKETILRV